MHKLYGASAHIGAVSLAKKCDYGQSLSIDNDNEIHKTHKAILIEYKRVNDFLSSTENHKELDLRYDGSVTKFN